MKQVCKAFWKGQDIVVTVAGTVVDRIPGDDIRRVVFVERGVPQSASDHAFALLELDDAHVLFPPDSGFAGLVHFERQAFWAGHRCVYWSSLDQVQLPRHCKVSRGLLRRGAPLYQRIARAEAPGLVDGWRLEGPQSWDERRMQRIETRRGFSAGPGSAAASILYLARHRA